MFWSSTSIAQIDFSSFVYIECKSPFGDKIVRGSGVIVGEAGEVLTAKHVAPKGFSCRGARGPSSAMKLRNLSLRKYSEKYDAVTLQFERGPGELFEPHRYARLDSALKGAPISAYGMTFDNPINEFSVRKGVVSTIRPNKFGNIQTDALSAPGMSGGPVLIEESGALLGIVAGATFDPSTGAPTSYEVLVAEVIGSELDLKPFKEKSVLEGSDRISESYVRLSGAAGVYPLLGLIEGGGSKYTSELGDSCSPNNGIGVDCSILDFWSGSDFSDAKPLLNENWTKANNSDFLRQAVFTASSNSVDHFFCHEFFTKNWVDILRYNSGRFYINVNSPFFEGNAADPAFRQPLSLVPRSLGFSENPQEVERQLLDNGFSPVDSADLISSESGMGKDILESFAPKKRYLWEVCRPLLQSGNVGFLFIVVENSSRYTLTNVYIDYEVFYQNDTQDLFWENLDLDGDELIDDMEKTRTQRLPDMSPGEQFLILSSIYAAGDDNFERFQLTPLELPLAINYKTEGRDQMERIRLPRRRAVFPIPMPLGWYRQ